MNDLSNSTIKFAQTRFGKKPERAHSTDAGIDFFIPVFTSDFIKDLIDKNQYLLNREGYNGAHTTVSCYPSTTSLSITAGPSGTIGCSGIRLDTVEKQIPENLNIVKFDSLKGKSYIELYSHDRLLIPSGIHCQMESHNRALIAANKSGVASKDGLVFGAQVVDSSYQGEIHISVINTSNVGVRIYEDMKIIQFVETPVYTSELKFEDSLRELYDEKETDRGSAGFGSTDLKQLNS